MFLDTVSLGVRTLTSVWILGGHNSVHIESFHQKVTRAHVLKGKWNPMAMPELKEKGKDISPIVMEGEEN